MGYKLKQGVSTIVLIIIFSTIFLSFSLTAILVKELFGTPFGGLLVHTPIVKGIVSGILITGTTIGIRFIYGFIIDNISEIIDQRITYACQGPDLQGNGAGPIYETINGNVDKKLDIHHKKVTKDVMDAQKVRDDKLDATLNKLLIVLEK